MDEKNALKIHVRKVKLGAFLKSFTDSSFINAK